MLNKPRLLTPGPTPLPERVRLAMAQDMIHHRKAPFKAIMAETQELLQKLFGTSQVVLPLSCSGTGSMTAAVHGLFKAGEKVIIVDAGKFGERWNNIAQTRGLETVIIKKEWGTAVSVADIEEALAAHPDAAGVLVQCSETSTGVQHPVQDIAAMTRQRDILLVVDGISSVGISPCPMDEWGVDCLLTGSQKGLMLPPALALIALSERAWVKAESIATDCFYFNLPKERDNCLKNQTLFTTPVSLIVGLHESLTMFFEFGLDEIYRKQWALTSLARAGVQALGLEPLAKDHFTWGLTSIRLPDGVDGNKVIEHAAKHYGVIMAGGQDALKGRIVRLGHMGWVDWADVVAGLHALAMSLQATSSLSQEGTRPSFTAPNDYMMLALKAYADALEE